jgi:hypothetical protein
LPFLGVRAGVALGVAFGVIKAALELFKDMFIGGVGKWKFLFSF